MKLDRNICKADTYLAVMKRSWDIESRSQICVETNSAVTVRSETIKPYQTVAPPKK